MVYSETGSPTHALETLGYRREGHDYVHVESSFQLEFPPGPLAIGDDLVTAWVTLHDGDRLLHLLSPTDSCRDRLAAFYHFNDRSALEQALSVYTANAGRIDLGTIEAWSAREGHGRRCAEFIAATRA